ncbi:Fur family transcriptional regulator [Gardnerella vaginalis]|uniref:Putative Ferric uptake regulation protein n=1 Tax=Gardnerella vaginalis TaxID=2702 RepID=A0A133NQL2_GARVA|nr:Fur family transcriptional regulator [Gardnerella vaginalis]KXA18584.1 putative Ferric uptake regulation protein [Gardnerella vaginalis]
MVGEPIRRNTKQKETVLEHLRASRNFVSAQNLHRALVEDGEIIGLATVYRQLNMLSQSGDVDTVRFNGQQLFRICDENTHHHHLVCEKCGKTVDIEPPDDEGWIHKIAESHGYTVIDHTLEVFGLCEECNKESNKEQ